MVSNHADAEPPVLRDLHTHSSASDGTLSPAALVDAAAARGITLLALTDHDTVAGLGEAAAAAAAHPLTLVPGVEVSVTWQGRQLHVLGLGVEPGCRMLLHGLEGHRVMRERRAEAIAGKLERQGIAGVGAQARALTGKGMVTRTHFARVLLDRGAVGSMDEAFKRFLGRGKQAWVGVQWAALDEVIGWIRSAGGVAVLAHPLRYRMTGAWMRRLLLAFREAGGLGIEVVAGQTCPSEIKLLTGYALRYGLLGSVGSDYHGPENPWSSFGKPMLLPPRVEPVWTGWETAGAALPRGEDS